ncbi:MAG: sigma 54-interacting transcriptional regulator [Deltaproteobacteria bacterium]|nr:sigma 54-interacting transcriptional regulator [Deltaproteobacteria bacterium]MCB9787312.1 sigma 54-interacting transcriptional regulator [Deltaproteobacteria bacterium]
MTSRRFATGAPVKRVLHQPPAQPPECFHGIVTVAPEMREVFELVRRVARTDAPTLIRGESGTGKELVARALHALSPRAPEPFQAINCAMLSSEMLASELFGHVKGAFTGAIRDRPGVFRRADGGTVFLDEIADMPLDVQARVLRVVQEQVFTPLGGTEDLRVDVRFLSATHTGLRRAVAQRRFRMDLMYRLRVVPLFLPRLVERSGDIGALTWHFVGERNALGGRRVEAIDGPAWDALHAFPWPGNIRELHNVIEYAFAVGEGPVLGLADLTPELRGEDPPDWSERSHPLRDQERRRILDALAAAGGRKSEAAQALGMSRSTLWRKLRELRIG